MTQQKQRLQLNDRKQEYLFLLLLIIISMAVFLLTGADGYVLFDDSGSYINLEQYVEGVMPIYPVFLRLNKILFGEAVFLYAVVVEQAVFASICLMIFNNAVRRQFSLGYPETFCIFLLSILPFTIDLPDAVTTREILTEGIAYAAFYLFMTVLLKAVWKKSLRGVIPLFLITLLLAATRSQLQILFGVCGVIFFYIVLAGKRILCRQDNKNKWPLRLLVGAVGCLLISLAGIWCTRRISITYQQALERYAQKRLEMAEQAAFQNMEMQENIEVAVGNGESESLVDSDDSDINQGQTVVAGQYTTLIFSRGMYEADYEDYLLFEDEQLQELFLYLYEAVDREACRYTYASPGLWMWKDIAGGIGSVGVECFYAQYAYYADKPEISQRSDYMAIRDANQMAIGIALIKAHWGRFLYHTLMMLPQAFICTVFFQIARIYLLCHLITLFLYLSAIGLMIWAYADRKVDREYAEFMSAVLGTNLVMILIISLVFFGQQRYLVYNFGIFYVVYFLLLLQFWKIYGKNWLMKWIGRKKS